MSALLQFDDPPRARSYAGQPQTITMLLARARRALNETSGDLAGLEARLLAQHAWGMSQEALVRHAEKLMDQASIAKLEALLTRRMNREPVAYITGVQSFWKQNFRVNQHTLIPRADSETLIEACLHEFPDRTAPHRILDLGTGSGCLALSLLAEYPNANAVAVDASSQALSVAEANARALKLTARVHFLCGNWCNSLDEQDRFAIVASNPPYIPQREIAELAAEVRDFEPHSALNGGVDGLDAYRELLKHVRKYMAPNGRLFLEVGQGQAAEVERLARAEAFSAISVRQDLQGIDRVVVLAATE